MSAHCISTVRTMIVRVVLAAEASNASFQTPLCCSFLLSPYRGIPHTHHSSCFRAGQDSRSWLTEQASEAVLPSPIMALLIAAPHSQPPRATTLPAPHLSSRSSA